MGEKIEIPVIWSDEHLLVIDKPAGLLTLPDGYDPSQEHVKAILSPQFEPLWIVHRLDRYTSGVLVLARSASDHRQLNTQFQERQVKKVYMAWVKGDPASDHKVVDQPLRTNAGRRHRTIVDLLNGKPSITRFDVLKRYGSYTLVKAAPDTGRRHQIGTHLASQGFPITCDSLYGNGKPILYADFDEELSGGYHPVETVLNRPGLHALALELKHPVTRKRVQFEAPYPRDFRLTLDILGNQFR